MNEISPYVIEVAVDGMWVPLSRWQSISLALSRAKETILACHYSEVRVCYSHKGYTELIFKGSFGETIEEKTDWLKEGF